jgi:pimeloyl-ACP methyl ester carboxylesterase
VAEPLVLGFTLIFILLGSAAGILGRSLNQYMPNLQKVGALLLVVFALTTLGVFRWLTELVSRHTSATNPAANLLIRTLNFPNQLLYSEKRVAGMNHAGRGWGYLSSVLFGITFAAGWTPCIGPILATILFMAGDSQTAWQSDGHKNINQWRLADYVADVAAVVAKLPAPPVLIGHSLGGVVVQKYLQHAPAAGGILLASSPLTGMVSASFRMMLRHPAPILKMFFGFNMLHARPAFETVFFSEDVPRERVNSYFAQMGNESFWAFMDVALIDKPNPKLVSTPMLVIGGEKDSSIPTAVNEALASAYGVKLETFPATHDMMLDPNWKLVADCILAWIQGQLGS